MYVYNGILSSLKKKILTYATIWMNLEDITLSEISKTQKDKHVGAYSSEVSRAVKLTEAESGMVPATGCGEEGMRSHCSIGIEFAPEKMQQVLEMGFGADSTTL